MAADPMAWLAPWMAIPAFRTAVTGVLDATSSSRAFCSVVSELRRRVVTDGHAPAEFRADTVPNLDPWYDPFHVVPGSRLYLAPEDRVRVW
jgi:hypothetical protein